MTGSGKAAGYVAALGAAACWGFATVMSKGALEAFPPILLLLTQVAASSVMLWLLIGFIPLPVPSWRRAVGFAWLGLLEPGLAYALGLTGLVDVPAGAASLIVASESIMIVLLSVLLLSERLTLRLIIVSVIAFAGLPFALGIGSLEMQGSSLVGIGLLIAGTLAAAFYVVLSSRFVIDHHPLIVVGYQQLVAFIFALCLLPLEGHLAGAPDLAGIAAGSWLLAGVSGFVQYALAFSLYLLAIRSISTGTAGIFLNLVPVFGLTGAFLFLGETLSSLQLLGVAITLGALVVLTVRPDTAPEAVES